MNFEIALDEMEEKAIKQNKIKIAKKLLKMELSIEQIVEATDLSVDGKIKRRTRKISDRIRES